MSVWADEDSVDERVSQPALFEKEREFSQFLDPWTKYCVCGQMSIREHSVSFWTPGLSIVCVGR